MSILKELFEDVLKDGERIAKDLNGKDVPKSPLRGHDDFKAILQGIVNLIKQGVEEGLEERAVELVKSGVDAAWDAIQGISVGEIKITREMYDVIVRALTDSIIELGGDK